MAVKADAQIQILVDALIETGWLLWRAAHNNTPKAHRLRQWMHAIRPGDLVLEISTTRSDRAMDRVGVLVAIISGHEYKIRTIDGREWRWENALFVRIPQNADDTLKTF